MKSDEGLICFNELCYSTSRINRSVGIGISHRAVVRANVFMSEDCEFKPHLWHLACKGRLFSGMIID